MGLSSPNTTTDGFRLCIFDLRRGQQEGQELDKILFFFPADYPFASQLSVIGLSEGLITFTRIFSPQAACEVIEAERQSYVFYEAEPDIWMVLVVEKNGETEAIWRNDALRSVLKEAHSLFVMFYGSIRTLLDKQPDGGLARSHLYFFISDYLTDFLGGKKFHLPSFRDCLRERGTIQMLSVGRDAAMEVQSLVRVLESSCAGSPSSKSLILFQDLLVSTTLSPVDTVTIFTYAVLRLTPHALSSGSGSWPYLRRVTSPNLGLAAENCQFPRPLQLDKWTKGKDGFLVTDIWGGEVGSCISSIPVLWLQESEERMYLCLYQHKNLTIILLIPVSSVVDGEQGMSLVKQQILENALLKILKVEEKLSRGWGGENAYHVSGYRYLLVDSERNISRASPPGKVTTLAKETLLSLSRLREEVDLEKTRSKRDDPDHEHELEICIRAKNNAWIIARVIRGKELYMALEKANEALLHASEAVEKFSNKYCDGAFSLD